MPKEFPADKITKMEKREIKVPHADKLVGIPKKFRNDSEAIDILESKLTELYITSGAERIKDLELDKNERDLAILRFVNHALAKYLRRYGKEIRNTPQDKIHILEDGGTNKFTRGKFSGGAHSSLYGSILVDRKKSDVDFALILFHEELHNQSYKALQVTTGNKPELQTYRSGIAITTRDGKVTYFTQIEEAIIELISRKFYKEEMLSNDLFVVDEKKPPQEIYFSRKEEAELLNSIINDILIKNPGASREEIEEFFIRAQISGNLLPIARLIEKTYGKGSFRQLGEKTEEKN